MKKSNRAFLSAGWAAAVTWFGTHCGSGFATGKQLITYINRHGTRGLWMTAAIWIILAFLFYIIYTYGNMAQSANYKEFANNFYKPYGRIVVTIWDIVIVFTTLIALGGFLATGGTMLMQIFGGAYWIWLLVYVVACFLITAFGARVVTKVGSIISIPLIGLLVLMFILGITNNFDGLKQVLSGAIANESTTTFKDMVYDVYNYAGIQNTFVAGAIGIACTLPTAKDVKQASLGGALLNCLMMYLGTLCLFAYYPQINNESLPILQIAQMHPWSRVLMIIYPITVILAVTSSVAPVTYGIINRFKHVGANKISSEKARLTLYSGIIIGVAAIISSVGLDAVVDKGYKISAMLRFPLIGIPIMVLGLFKIKKLRVKG